MIFSEVLIVVFPHSVIINEHQTPFFFWLKMKKKLDSVEFKLHTNPANMKNGTRVITFMIGRIYPDAVCVLNVNKLKSFMKP